MQKIVSGMVISDMKEKLDKSKFGNQTPEFSTLPDQNVEQNTDRN